MYRAESSHEEYKVEYHDNACVGTKTDVMFYLDSSLIIVDFKILHTDLNKSISVIQLVNQVMKLFKPVVLSVN